MTKVAFCGISGSGMSALAQVLKNKGYDVFGSDRSFDLEQDLENKKALESVGIHILKQDGSAITEDTDFLYVSTAVEDSISDVKKALDLGVSIKKRSDLLSEIFSSFETKIAVGGTSGKTTLTAMIGFILDKLSFKPTVINGGLMKNYIGNKGIPNVILKNGKIVVIEADESDGSIEKYTPDIALINNIGQDHKDLKDLKKLFFDFAKRSKHSVVNLDCVNSKELLSLDNVTTFSILNPNADVYLSDIKPIQNGVSYKLQNQTFTLKIIGAFNVLNAAAAIAVVKTLGVLPAQAAKILEEFEGTKRRLDVIGVKNNITVIDDFAHNPDKVKASVSALKDYKGRLLIVFQPHGFKPMKMMGKEIIESFASLTDKEDILFMPEIYYTGGTVTRDISSEDLVFYALKIGMNAVYKKTREEIKEIILKTAKKGDRIVVMGARDNSLTLFAQSILENLK